MAKKLSNLQLNVLSQEVVKRTNAKVLTTVKSFVTKQNEVTKAKKLIDELIKIEQRSSKINSELNILRETLNFKLKQNGYNGNNGYKCHIWWGTQASDAGPDGHIKMQVDSVSYQDIQTKIIMTTIETDGNVSEMLDKIVNEMIG
jgi:hypothetical protein